MKVSEVRPEPPKIPREIEYYFQGAFDYVKITCNICGETLYGGWGITGGHIDYRIKHHMNSEHPDGGGVVPYKLMKQVPPIPPKVFIYR